MGYYTYYSMDVLQGTDDDIAKVVQYLKNKDIVGYALDESLRPYDGVIWYEHHEDMIELSMAFPDLYFVLHGEGDDREDVWDSHYKNGMFQELYVSLVMPEIDPLKWTKSKSLMDAEIASAELPAFDANESETNLLLGVS